MFSNILIGVDHRDGGHDAVALAKLWFADGAQLTLAHVFVGDPSAYGAARAEYVASERELGLVRLDGARDEAGLRAEVRWLQAPVVARGLHELCEEIAADLLVVGSSRHGALGRVVAGDDTHDTVRHAPCAVAIAPTGYSSREPTPMREIGVGYDASPESRNALRVGKDLAAAHHTKLSALEVVHTPRDDLAARAAPDQERMDDMVVAGGARIAGIGEIEARTVQGRPAKELARYSLSLDLLVVGSSSHDRTGRPVRRSTAQQLAREARCPLLIVNRQTLPEHNA
jgi:nucleotide-binding universal stress UspA family protein